ncbi:MAG: TetR/AcrR family transcriptional regulator [Chloroflexota bacterium]
MTEQIDTRKRIIQAAASIMSQKGIARATTKEIARLAGCSEGNLYNHFASKEEIFLAILSEELPAFMPLLSELPERVGQGSPQETLAEIAHAALLFYNKSIPMGAAFFSERTLLERHRLLLKEKETGPHKSNQAITDYLNAEKEMGRLRSNVDAETVADMILGSCFMRAYWRQFIGEETSPKSDEEFIDQMLSIFPLGT